MKQGGEKNCKLKENLKTSIFLMEKTEMQYIGMHSRGKTVKKKKKQRHQSYKRQDNGESDLVFIPGMGLTTGFPGWLAKFCLLDWGVMTEVFALK